LSVKIEGILSSCRLMSLFSLPALLSQPFQGFLSMVYPF